MIAMIKANWMGSAFLVALAAAAICGAAMHEVERAPWVAAGGAVAAEPALPKAVPNVIGMTVPVARDKIEHEELTALFSNHDASSFSDTANEAMYTVTSQDPIAGSPDPIDRTVRCRVSSTEVPICVSKDKETAKDELRAKQLGYMFKDSANVDVTNSSAKYTVSSQTPSAGTITYAGDIVHCSVISSGPGWPWWTWVIVVFVGGMIVLVIIRRRRP